MQAILRDVRYGFRTLVKNPALSLVAIIALTFGIGLTTTMFSIVYGALMKGLPFPDGNRIVDVHRNNPTTGARRMGVPISDYVEYRDQQQSFDAIGGWRTKDGEFDIDPAGTLPDGRSFAGAPELRKILLDEPGPFRRNMVEKMLTYALGRGLENYDRCSVTAIESELERNGDRFSALVRGIVHSAPFQKRQAPVEVKP